MAENLPVYVLDSFAVLAHFQAESGGEKVLDLLTRAARAALVTGDPEFKKLKDNPSLFWLE